MNTAEKVQVVAPTPAPETKGEMIAQPDTIMAIIARASVDPNCDVDKLERLLAIRDKEIAAQAEKEFNQAMKRAQTEMEPISADAMNPQTRSRYARYAKLDRALRPIYTKEGFALSFDTTNSPKPGHERFLCYVTHQRGGARTYHIDMPTDGKGAKGGDVMTATHAVGSAASYGMRYLLKMIFNVAIGEDDDDGNGGGDQELDAISQWIDVIKDCPDITSLKNRGAELARSALSGKARAKVRPVFEARMKELSK